MADSSVSSTANNTIDTRTATNGDHRQVVVLGNDGDFVTGVEPFGALQVNNGFQTLFYDEWATSPIDTVDRWTVTGTTPTVASGNMDMVATASTFNAIRTKDTVRPNVGFSLVRNGIKIEAAASTGAGRFWGLGTPATTPGAAVLAQDGVGFELDQAAGNLLAVTYAAGARTVVATLTRPADGLTHAYGVYFRVTQAYWTVDGVQVAAQAFPNVMVAALPALIVRQNAAAFTGTPVFTNIAHLTADTSRQGTVIADPVVGTRMARVGADGTMKVSGTGTAGVSATSVQTVQGIAGGTPLPVSGAFFQATQPVSLATNTPDMTDRAGRLVGVVDTEMPAAAALADGMANPTSPAVAAETMLFNGSTWDRGRGNYDTATGDSGVKTASFTGATQVNYNASGALISVRLSTVSGTTPTLTGTLQWSPDGGTTWLQIHSPSTALTATGQTLSFFVGPSNWSVAGATPAALSTGSTVLVALNASLPRLWRINYVIAGTLPSFNITGVYVNYLV